MRDMGLGKLVSNTGGTLARQLASVALGVGLTVLLARVLGPEGNGVYAVVILFLALLSTFFNLGIPTANTYFVSRGDVSFRRAYRSTLQLSAVLSAIGITLAAVLLIGWGERLFPGVPNILLWGSLVVFPLMLFQSLLCGLLLGKQDFQRYNSVVLVPSVATLLITVVTVWISRGGVPGALAAVALGQMIGLFVTWRAVAVHLQEIEPGEQLVDYTKQALVYGWKTYVGDGLAFVNRRVDLFLVNLLLNPATTGVYVIAIQLVERLWMLSQAVSMVMLPRLSELHHDEAKRKALTPLVSRWTLLLSGLGAVLLGLIARPLINVLVGGQYDNAAETLLWFLPGVVMGSFSRVLAGDIGARGRPELNIYPSLVAAVFNIVTNYILIPAMGINGAALATSLTYSATAIARLCIYTRLSGNVWYKVVLIDRSDWELLKYGVNTLRKRALSLW